MALVVAGGAAAWLSLKNEKGGGRAISTHSAGVDPERSAERLKALVSELEQTQQDRDELESGTDLHGEELTGLLLAHDRTIEKLERQIEATRGQIPPDRQR